MKRKLKWLLVLVTTFCAALTLGVLAACDKDPDEEPVDYGDPATDGYVVTVLYPDGSPVKNTDGDSQYDKPTVELTDEDGVRIEKAYINASGVAQINYFEPGEYYIKVTDYPTGYTFDNTSVKTTTDRAFYTVSLELGPPTPYVFNVTYPDGTAMEGVTVKLMDGTKTVATAITDADGAATTAETVRGAYSVTLENLPFGYSYRPVSTTIAAWPMTIETVGATHITFEDEEKLEGAALQAWDNALNSKILNFNRFDPNGDCYGYTAEFGAGQEVFFTIHAPKTGAYTIGSMQGNDYVIQFYTEDLSSVDSSLTISSETNGGNNVQLMQIDEGETLTFSVKSQSRKAGTVELLVCLPVPKPYSRTIIEPGQYAVSFEQFNTAILQFVTSKTEGQGFGQGVYKFTSLSEEYDVMIVEYVNTYPSTDPNSDLTGDYAGKAGNDNGAGDDVGNFVFTRTWPQSYIGPTVEYRIIIKNEVINYPVTIDILVERIGDAEDAPEAEQKIAEAHVSETFENQLGVFTWMPTDGSLEPYRKDDGYWYVEVNGVEKPLTIAITKNLSGWFSFATIDFMGESEEMSNKRESANLNVYANLNTRDELYDYFDFIQEYAKYVNKDGVYQVNDELKLFLERFMNQRYSNVTGSTVKPANPWLLGCGYYAL